MVPSMNKCFLALSFHRLCIHLLITSFSWYWIQAHLNFGFFSETGLPGVPHAKIFLRTWGPVIPSILQFCKWHPPRQNQVKLAYFRLKISKKDLKTVQKIRCYFLNSNFYELGPKRHQSGENVKNIFLPLTAKIRTKSGFLAVHNENSDWLLVSIHRFLRERSIRRKTSITCTGRRAVFSHMNDQTNSISYRDSMKTSDSRWEQ